MKIYWYVEYGCRQILRCDTEDFALEFIKNKGQDWKVVKTFQETDKIYQKFLLAEYGEIKPQKSS